MDALLEEMDRADGHLNTAKSESDVKSELVGDSTELGPISKHKDVHQGELKRRRRDVVDGLRHLCKSNFIRNCCLTKSNIGQILGVRCQWILRNPNT
jgi:hypothetical protein